jgi:hypothetical protein
VVAASHPTTPPVASASTEAANLSSNVLWSGWATCISTMSLSLRCSISERIHLPSSMQVIHPTQWLFTLLIIGLRCSTTTGTLRDAVSLPVHCSTARREALLRKIHAWCVHLSVYAPMERHELMCLEWVCISRKMLQAPTCQHQGSTHGFRSKLALNCRKSYLCAPPAINHCGVSAVFPRMSYRCRKAASQQIACAASMLR